MSDVVISRAFVSDELASLYGTIVLKHGGTILAITYGRNPGGNRGFLVFARFPDSDDGSGPVLEADREYVRDYYIRFPNERPPEALKPNLSEG